MATVMFRGRSLRGSRHRGRPENNEEFVRLDYSKETGVNLQEVLVNIVKPHGVTKGKRLGYYNAFVRLCHRCNGSFFTSLTKAQIISCLRVGLFHEGKEVRAASLRALRYYVRDESTLDALLRLHTDFLIARSLDICLANDIERIHAMHLIRKIMHISPKHVATSLVNVMVSIANDGVKEKDKMVKTCLATLCELAFLNPSQVSSCGGTSAILHSVLDCHQLPRINESLVATILYLLNHPSTRHHVHPNTDLERVLAPFTDLHFRYSASTPEQNLREERENRFIASKMATATIIKSWPGMMRFCKPDGSGLHSLLGVLYLPQMETRKEIMDVLFEVFRLQVPVWTDDFHEALTSVDPSQLQESWRLREGFVAEEGKALLPHLAKTRPNLVDNHMALILSVMISAGLLEALITVIGTSEDFVSVRATILLGELLHLSNTIIPYENSSHSHCLPTLVSLASSPEVQSAERNRAKMAITCLSRQHALKKRGAVPCSLFLDQIVRQSAGGAFAHLGKVSNEKLVQCLTKDAEQEILMQSLRDSQVLSSRPPSDWDWDLISSILKWPDASFLKLEEQHSQRFLKKLLNFFKPLSKQYSAIDVSSQDHRKYTLAALNLVDLLLESEDDEAPKHIEEWLKDIAVELSKVRSPHAPHDVLFSPACLMNTLSQHYFLIIGRFSASPVGDKFLESTGIYQYLLDIVTISNHDTYIKVIVSSLDYTCDGMTRIILSKALTATSEAARLYTASFMRVLLRARVPFLSNWGMEMLVMQLYDQSKPVAMEALSVISEACEEEVNLHTLINMRPSVLHLGYKGALLLARFLSIPAGYKFLCDTNYVSHELDKWHKSFNMKYVEIVDEQLNEALTTYEKTYDGSYTRRSARRQPRKDVFVPIHLYGQLVQHKHGFELLRKQRYIHEYFDRIRVTDTPDEFQALKAALWVVGHIGTSLWGLGMLEDENIIPYIIKHAEENDVFSIRGTAYYVLGLIAATSKGADLLAALGWESVRHQRSELWPVIENDEMKLSAVYNTTCASVTASTVSLSHSEPGGRNAYWTGQSASSLLNDMYHVSHSPKDHCYLADKFGKQRGDTSSSVESISNQARRETSSSVESISNKVRSPGSSESLPQKVPLIISDSSDVLQAEMSDSVNQPSLSKDRVDALGTMESLVSSDDVENKWPSNTSDSLDRWRSDTTETIGSTGDLSDSASFKQPPFEDEEGVASKIRCSSSTSEGIVFVARSRASTSMSSTRMVTSEDEDVFPDQPTIVAASHTSGVSGSAQSSELSDSDGFHTPGMRTSVSPPMLNGTLPTGKISDSSLDSPAGKLDVPSVVKFRLTPDKPSMQGPMSAPPSLNPPRFPISEAGPLDHRGERSGSNESSRTSKSHSDSIGTDNTSGVSSLDSGHPSDDNPTGSRAITTGAKNLNPEMGQGPLQSTPKPADKSLHPSNTLRARVNLRRIPDLSGRFSSISKLSPLKNLSARHMSESMLSTKFNHDSAGYATFRDLQRIRMLNADFGVEFLAPTIASHGISKTKSLDFRLGKASGTAHSSYTSLPGDANSAPTTPYSSLPRSISCDKVPKMLPSAIRAEYIGITLPVDVSMMFQDGDFDMGDKENKIPEIRMEQTKLHVKHVNRSISEMNCDNGLEMHTKLSCLGCYSTLKPEERTVLIGGATDSESVLPSSDQFASDCDTRNTSPSTYGGTSPADAAVIKDLKGAGSFPEVLAGSVTSNTSVDSAVKPMMNEESETGRTLIRKEIMRLIVALSSSVGVRGSEQGLLLLKQQYSKSFHDICMYSEVCTLLANYNYRLSARRFIQELFQDVTFEKLLMEPYEVLEINPEEGKDAEEEEPFFCLENVPESVA